MNENTPPHHWPATFFTTCLLILGALIALSLAIDILRCIWPWLAGTTAVVGGMVLVVRLVRRGRQF